MYDIVDRQADEHRDGYRLDDAHLPPEQLHQPEDADDHLAVGETVILMTLPVYPC